MLSQFALVLNDLPVFAGAKFAGGSSAHWILPCSRLLHAANHDLNQTGLLTVVHCCKKLDPSLHLDKLNTHTLTLKQQEHLEANQVHTLQYFCKVYCTVFIRDGSVSKMYTLGGRQRKTVPIPGLRVLEPPNKQDIQ